MPAAPADVAAAVRLTNGYQVSRAIHTGLALGLFDQLVEESASDDVATKLGAHGPSLYRLMRALAAVGVLHEAPDRRFALTPIGECFCKTGPIAQAATMYGQGYYWDAWGELEHSVRTGETAFVAAHGMSAWQYREQHPEASRQFNDTMTSISRRLAAAIVFAYDFSRFGTVIDVGGGAGAMISTILKRHRTLRGVLFDLPEAVAAAEAQLTAAGVADRARCVGGSFFEEVPSGGDAYLLVSVLHNWDDERATAILKTCRRAMAPGAMMLVIESDLGAPNADAEPKFLDLNMLVMHGARERSHDEYRALLHAAELEWIGAKKTSAGLSVLEARAL